jgi:hypothetical protein
MAGRRFDAARIRLCVLLAGTLVALVPACRREPEGFSRQAGSLGTVREYRPAATPTALVFLFSDRDGWQETLGAVTAPLAARGAVVVGVDLPPTAPPVRSRCRRCRRDCRRVRVHPSPPPSPTASAYFWNQKDPDVLARDLDRILRHYTSSWGASRVLLVGYSFGADVLPFIVDRLPPDSRRQVEQVSLLGLSREATFEFHVTSWLDDTPSGDTHPVLAELLRLDLHQGQCIHGEDEDGALCRAPELAGAEIIRTTGGHHFDGDYGALAGRATPAQAPVAHACAFGPRLRSFHSWVTGRRSRRIATRSRRIPRGPATRRRPRRSRTSTAACRAAPRAGSSRRAVLKAISNKTHQPVRVPLPGGRTLRLGPGKTGEIAANAVDHPPLKKLLEAGTIEIVADGRAAIDALPSGGQQGGPRRSFSPGAGRHRSGDR